MKKENKIFYIKYLVLLIIFLAPRIFMLGPDISNSDALRWHLRTQNFEKALKELNFFGTYQRYHPGVTLMWLGTAADLMIKLTQNQTQRETLTLGNADFYSTYHGFSKLILVGALAVLFIFQIVGIRKLYGEKVFILYGVLLSLEPYFAGINRWFHLTSLEAMLSMNSLIYLLLYFKSKKKLHLLLSGIFCGLGILSKMTVMITALFNGLALLYQTKIKREKILTVFLYTLLVLFTIFIFFPALWTSLVFVLQKMSAALSGAVSSDPRGELLSFWQKIFYYPIILLFKTTPILFIFGLFSIFKNIKLKTAETVLPSIYFLFVVFFLSLSDQKIDRYSITLFPVLVLCVSIWLSSTRPLFQNTLLLFQTIFCLVSILIYYPVLSAYINPLIPFKVVLNSGFYENSGEYYSNAAFYLNQKGRGVNTYIPNNIDSFKPYYKGSFTDDLKNTDYIVYGLDFDRKTFASYEGCTPEIYFGNILYKPLAVYKCSKQPVN